MADIGIHFVRSVAVETKQHGGSIWTVITIRGNHGSLPEQETTVTLFHNPDGITAPFIDAKYAPVAEEAA